MTVQYLHDSYQISNPSPHVVLTCLYVNFTCFQQKTAHGDNGDSQFSSDAPGPSSGVADGSEGQVNFNHILVLFQNSCFFLISRFYIMYRKGPLADGPVRVQSWMCFLNGHPWVYWLDVYFVASGITSPGRRRRLVPRAPRWWLRRGYRHGIYV